MMEFASSRVVSGLAGVDLGSNGELTDNDEIEDDFTIVRNLDRLSLVNFNSDESPETVDSLSTVLPTSFSSLCPLSAAWVASALTVPELLPANNIPSDSPSESVDAGYEYDQASSSSSKVSPFMLPVQLSMNLTDGRNLPGFVYDLLYTED
jgi:hypothetical protein